MVAALDRLDHVMADLTGGPLKNVRHERFCNEIVSGKSQAEAYRLAGYKPDTGAASRLSANVSIQARIAELCKPVFDEYEVSNASVQREMALIGFHRPKSYKRFLASGNLDDVTSEQSAAIREVKTLVDAEGNSRIEVKFADKMPSLNSLARILGMMKDGPDVSIPVSFTVEFAAPPKGD